MKQKTIKALSFLQPWGSLIMMEAKKWETRPKAFWFTGWLACHTSQRFPRCYQTLCESHPFLEDIEQPFDLPRGQIIGMFEMLACERTNVVRMALEERGNMKEIAYGDYRSGRYAWKIGRVIHFREGIECKGALSIWKVPPRQAGEVLERLPRNVLAEL